MAGPITHVSIEEQQVLNVLQGKVENYSLNSDTAQDKLLENARRSSMTSNLSSNNTQFFLSTGAHKEVIFPLLGEWSNIFPVDGGLELNSTVTLTELRHDRESSGLNVQSVASFFFNGKKITVHFYHTNQKGMIQGQLHQQFFNHFLHPLLEKLFSEKVNQINQFNNAVINALKPGFLKPDQNDSVWRSETPARGNSLKLTRKQPKTMSKHQLKSTEKPRSLEAARELRLRAARQMVSTVPALTQFSFPGQTIAPPPLLSDLHTSVEILLDDSSEPGIHNTLDESISDPLTSHPRSVTPGPS